MLAERGVNVDHLTIYRWVQRYAPEMEKNGCAGTGVTLPISPVAIWDETYEGQFTAGRIWKPRAVDSRGRTVDFISPPVVTAKLHTISGKILNNVKRQDPAIHQHGIAARQVSRRRLAQTGEGRKGPSDVEHRQIKYRNNVIECDHGKLKRIIGATLGFKSMKTAYATIKGIEVMRASRKAASPAFYYGDPGRNAPVLERA